MSLFKKLILPFLALAIFVFLGLASARSTNASSCGPTRDGSVVTGSDKITSCAASQDDAIAKCGYNCLPTDSTGKIVSRGSSCTSYCLPPSAGVGVSCNYTGYAAKFASWSCTGSCGTTANSCSSTTTYTCSNSNHTGTCPTGKTCKAYYGEGHYDYVCQTSTTSSTCNEKPTLSLVKNTKDGNSRTFILQIFNNNLKSCTPVDFYREIGAGQLGNWNYTIFPSPFVNVPSQDHENFSIKVTPSSNATTNKSFEVLVGNARIVGAKTDKISLTYNLSDSGGNDGGGQNKCKQAPDVNITPNSLTGKPGQSQNANVKITNQNDPSCGASDFTLSHNDLGSKWTATFDSQTINIKPGDSNSKTVKVTVKPNKSVAKGVTKTVTVNAKSGNKPAGTANVAYTVSASGDNNPPPTEPPVTNPPGDGGGNGGTKLNVTLGIDGMGTTAKIPIGGNPNPIDGYSSRPLTFKLYNTSNNDLSDTIEQSVSFNISDKKFHATFSLSDSVTTGSYNIYAIGLPYINARIPGSITITKGATTPVSNNNFYLITGNINDKDQSENKIDLLDYNVMISCWIYSTNSNACDQDDNYISNSDLNGDGQVDQDDYTLFLKEIGNQGAALPDE